MKPELPILLFITPHEWRAWLEEHHATADGLWMQFTKKGSGVSSITYDEALEEALCYGWIDSQVKRYDEQFYLQRFGPRRSKSVWSKINTQHIERLIQEGRMKPAGMKVVEEAKADGRWDAAYHPQSTMEVHEDFLQELAKNKKAKASFETLSKRNKYAIVWRLQTAKNPETRAKRIAQIVEMLEKGETFH